ncbi:MAG: DUF1836 domain-containing protein [Peptococcaceae bacterium]|nr:DUF1836 domain-containing protein [Peptococcaceae bacterium]
MAENALELPREAADKYLNFHCPRYDELPAIQLYLDQVIRVINDALEAFFSMEGEKLITGAMINNYVKQKVVPPPKKKLYDRSQLTRLLVVAILKQVFTIPEISRLFEVQQATYPLEKAYDYFCAELENALRVTFGRQEGSMPSLETKKTAQTELLRSMVLAVANKTYVQTYVRLVRPGAES